MQTNPSDSPDHTIYDHVYRAYEGVSKKTKEITNAASSQASALYTKADQLKNNYLTTDFLKKKSKQMVLAKTKPLSSPDDLNNQIKTVKGEINFLNRLKLNSKSELAQINSMIEKQKIHPSGKKNKLGDLVKSKAEYEDRIAGLKDSISNKKSVLGYLNSKKYCTIGGNISFYAGWIAGLVIPGSGRSVGLALTTTNMAVQKMLTKTLPHDENSIKEPSKAGIIARDEKKGANLTILIGVASTVMGLAFSVFAMPTVQKIFWNMVTPEPPFPNSQQNFRHFRDHH